MIGGKISEGSCARAPVLRAFCLLVLVCLVSGVPASAQTAWLVGDFDGDNKPDLITVRTSRSGSAKAIGAPSIQSGAFDTAIFTLVSRFPTQRLRARDLDGDSDRDIVLETMSSVAIAVWINDGAGHFARGNLEDFRSQLGPAESANFSAAARQLPCALTDENPAIDGIPHLSSSRLPHSSAGRYCIRDQHFRVSALSALTTRGPPRNV
jgi:hypothetical protein